MKPRWSAPVAAFLLGLLLGLALMQALGVRERMQSDLEARKWQTEATQWHSEAKRLKDEVGRINKNARPHLYIQDVAVIVLQSPVPQSEVVEALSPYTQALLGLSLDYLKTPVVFHLFNHRIINIGTRLYRIHVNALLLGPHSELMISLLPEPGSAST